MNSGIYSWLVYFDPKEGTSSKKWQLSPFYVNQLFSADQSIQKVYFYICFPHKNKKKCRNLNTALMAQSAQ